MTTYEVTVSPNMYLPLRFGFWQPRYTYPPTIDLPTEWLYAKIGGIAPSKLKDNNLYIENITT